MVSWNAGAERIFGCTEAEVIGHHISQFFPEDSGNAEQFGGIWRKPMPKAGKKMRLGACARTEADELRGFAQITRDITELRQLEREVLQISEAEQRRIRHDLHDGLGQELTGLTLLSQSLGRMSPAPRRQLKPYQAVIQSSETSGNSASTGDEWCLPYTHQAPRPPQSRLR